MATRYETVGIRMVTLATETIVGKYSMWAHSYCAEEHGKMDRLMAPLRTIAAGRIGRHIFQLRGVEAEGLWTLYSYERREDERVLYVYTGKYTEEAMRQFAAGWEVIYTAR